MCLKRVTGRKDWEAVVFEESGDREKGSPEGNTWSYMKNPASGWDGGVLAVALPNIWALAGAGQWGGPNRASKE